MDFVLEDYVDDLKYWEKVIFKYFLGKLYWWHLKYSIAWLKSPACYLKLYQRYMDKIRAHKKIPGCYLLNLGNRSHSLPIPAVASRTVCPDISLIIQDLLPSNPTLLSEFQHLSYIDEKSMMLSCICAHEHCPPLILSSPHYVCDTKLHKAQYTLARPCYIIKLGKRFQDSLCDPGVSWCWDPMPELSTTSCQYVNPTSVTHCGSLITLIWMS